jgi:two-component system response regulator RegA
MINRPQILVVDDDPDVLKTAKLVLGRDFQVVALAAGEGIVEQAGTVEAVLLDMNLIVGERSGAQGLGLMAQLQASDPALSVVLMTTYGGVALAVEALKQGAQDFVLKPWRNEALTEALAKAVAATRERRRFGAQLNLDALEKRAIEKALTLYDGNISHAAQALGLTRPALYRRMERHGL